MRIFRSKSK